jgi:hypothetical protein
MQSQSSGYLVPTIFTQLSAVLGHAELLAQRTTDANSMEAAGTIKGATPKLRSLVQQLAQ